MRLPLFFFAIVLGCRVTAAPLTRDLGQGLVFYRVHEVPADLPAGAPTRKQPCVLDLRYAKGGVEAPQALDEWLKSRASSTAPLLILANGDTERELRTVLDRYEPDMGVMLIGVPARDFRPDLAVQSSAERERQAYDALENGVSLTALLTDNPDKVRNDEASLSKDSVPAPAEGAEAAGEKRPPVDAALQRAVHLHRALLALKRI